MNGSQYFSLDNRCFDDNGKTFGEATVKIAVEKFPGAKRIDNLEAFPLQYHRTASEIKHSLIECGRKFVSLVGGSHHPTYDGQAFWKDKDGNINKVFVKSRVMIDAAFFRRQCPCYDKPQVQQRFCWDDLLAAESYGDGDPQTLEVLPSELAEHDLLICKPTITGFSLADKIWRGFAQICTRIAYADIPQLNLLSLIPPRSGGTNPLSRGWLFRHERMRLYRRSVKHILLKNLIVTSMTWSKEKERVSLYYYSMLSRIKIHELY